MKKLSIFLIAGALLCGSMFGQAQSNERYDIGWVTRAGRALLPTLVSGQYLTNNGTNLSWGAISFAGYLRADGTVPLTANWPMGAFTLSQATWQGVAIAAGYGGTGLASYAVGDILHATGATTIGKLADVAVGQVLTSGGVGAVPAYNASPTLTGTLAANNLTADPTLSAEQLTNVAGWTATTNWTFADGAWSHATGSAVALIATGETAIAIGTKYRIIMTLTTSTVGGGVAVSLGGQSFAAVSTGAPTAHTFNVTARSTAALALTPTDGTWVGSLTVSIKIITNGAINAEGITLNSGQLLLSNGNMTYLAMSFSRSLGSGIFADQYGNIHFTYNGDIYFSISGSAGMIRIGPNLSFGTSGGSSDSFLIRKAAAIFQLGIDAAAPVAQTFKGPDGSGNNNPSGGLSINDGVGTGAGVPIGPKIQSAYSLPAAATASTLQTAYVRQWAVGKTWSLSNNSATALFSVSCVDGSMASGYLVYSIEVTDGTDFQSESGVVTFTGINKAVETWTTDIDKGTVSQAVSAGALTTTWATDTATADTLKVTLNSNSATITPTSIRVRLQIFLNSPQIITIL